MTDADLLRRILGAMRPDIPMDWHDQAWLAAKGLATLEAIEAEAATPAPHLADCGYDEPHEPHTYVLAENDRPVDHECPGLAATPAPLAVLYGFPKSYTESEAAAWIAGVRAATPAPLDVLVAALEIIAASPSPAMSTDAIGITARNIARLALKQAAAPAPLDVEREALRRQHLEETHRASGSCPGWTCPTARVLTALAPGDES